MVKVNLTFVNCVTFWAENGADCIFVVWVPSCKCKHHMADYIDCMVQI